MEKKDLEEVFRRNGLLTTYQEQLAVALWPSVVDELMAHLTMATHVDGGVLHVVAEAAAIAHELQAQEEDLVQRIHRKDARTGIRGIRFSVGEVRRRRREIPSKTDPTARARSETILKGIEPGPLRDAFLRLAMAQHDREASSLAAGARKCPRCGLAFSGDDSICPGCRYDAVDDDRETD